MQNYFKETRVGLIGEHDENHKKLKKWLLGRDSEEIMDGKWVH